MSMQTGQESHSGSHSGFFNSVAGQMTMLVGGLAIVLVLAWLYVW